MNRDASHDIDAAGRAVTGRGGDSVLAAVGGRRSGPFESLPQDPKGCPPGCRYAQSVEGWMIFASNIHEECNEEDMRDVFGEFGLLRNIHLNLDKATLVVKGYVVVEYVRYEDAARAVQTLNGKMYRDRRLMVDFAFLNEPTDRGDVMHRKEEGEGGSTQKRSGTTLDRGLE